MLKQRVKDHWEAEPCDSRSRDPEDESLHFFQEEERRRYEAEPFIPAFADFPSWHRKRVLEVGIGIGTDFRQWVAEGADATGFDLTLSGVRLTRKNLDLHGISPWAYKLLVCDAENSCLRSNFFDLVYSYGVLHHTPRTDLALAEAWRVLTPGGTLKIMVYHVPSWTGWMLWLLHGLFRGKPLRSAKGIIFQHLESPGTKACTVAEIRQLVASCGFCDISTEVFLGPSDLLTIERRQKYQGRLFTLLAKTYPRRLIRKLGRRFGLLLCIEGKKPAWNTPLRHLNRGLSPPH